MLFSLDLRNSCPTYRSDSTIPYLVQICALPRIFMALTCSVNWATITSPRSSFSL